MSSEVRMTLQGGSGGLASLNYHDRHCCSGRMCCGCGTCTSHGQGPGFVLDAAAVQCQEGEPRQPPLLDIHHACSEPGSSSLLKTVRQPEVNVPVANTHLLRRWPPSGKRPAR